jgi:hypothetical protein
MRPRVLFSIRTGAALAALWTLFVVLPVHAQTAALPAPPETFDTPYVAPTGNTITVNAGGDLQAALDRAQLGDTIVLQAGATFSGSFALPRKSGTGWVYVQSSAYSSLPAPGTRVTPAHAALMPTIVASIPNTPAFVTAPGAHHFRFVGLRVRPASGRFVTNLIHLGADARTLDDLPSWIIFDRCYIHGDPDVGGRRGVALDGRYVAVVDSHVSDFKEPGADTQAVWAHSAPGPFKLLNNYLEAAGENVMFGGADSPFNGAVPADIEVRGNLFQKPLTWRGSRWVVKNLFELKNAKRVLVIDNRFVNSWPASQRGFAWVLTPANDGNAPWATVEDVAFIRNRVENAASGVNILAYGYPAPTRRVSRVTLRDNVFDLGSFDGSAPRLFQILGGPADIVIDHTTAIFRASSGVTMMFEGARTDRFTFTNNIVGRGEYGILGTGTSEGNATLGTYVSGLTFERNVFVGESRASVYPSGTLFAATVADVRFVDASQLNLALRADSPHRGKAADGTDLGARQSGEAASTTRVQPRAPSGIRIE